MYAHLKSRSGDYTAVSDTAQIAHLKYDQAGDEGSEV